MDNLVPIERIENKILLMRGQKVMIDRDLAELYGVGTRDLNKAVSRNLDRFPDDFMFQLSKDETKNLMSHFGTSSWGGVRKLPRVYTEQGVAMLSSILRSKRAIKINISIMRAFTHLRQILSGNTVLTQKIGELEKKYNKHEIEISTVFKLLKRIMEPRKKTTRKIGFLVDRDKKDVKHA